MNPPSPDDPYGDELAMQRLFRQVIANRGWGNVESGSSQAFATWALGLFGASIVIMLGFVLNAVYTTNGDLHEVKGQNALLQGEVSSMQLQLTNLAERVAITDAGKHGT